MMSNTVIVSPDLDRVRQDLRVARESLDNSQLDEAIEALVHAVAFVAHSVERLAELPACDGSHGS